jgi:Glyoxalase/Bleomycin resistance protein/Dioxygenase superfamily
MQLSPGNVFQSAYVVKDLKASMRRWHEANGAGPFFYMENWCMGPDTFSYRGKPGSVNFGVALGQMGQFQLELIEPYDDLPSAFRDTYKVGEEGFHHFGIVARDYDMAVAHYTTRGFAVAQSGLSNGMRFTYFDTRREFQCMTEIIEDVPTNRQLLSCVREAADGWGGGDPFRPLLDVINRIGV